MKIKNKNGLKEPDRSLMVSLQEEFDLKIPHLGEYEVADLGYETSSNHVRILDLINKNINIFPLQIGRFPNLTTLDATGNKYTQINTEILSHLINFFKAEIQIFLSFERCQRALVMLRKIVIMIYT